MSKVCIFLCFYLPCNLSRILLACRVLLALQTVATYVLSRMIACLARSMDFTDKITANVPTAMMIAESVNNTFGRTVNPRNRLLTSGGSSGGESALIAFKGSPLGIGTDIGGSLRIPAACTGIFTLRPSFGRFPTLKCRSGMSGQEAVQSVNGPLARTLDDIELEAKTVVDSKPWLHDPRMVPLPWRNVELPTKLHIAVMWNDGMVEPTPPVTRALKNVVEKLKASGHDIVEWDPKDQAQGLSLLGRMFVADGGLSIQKELERSGEPLREEMAAYGAAKELGTYEMWQIHMERTDFQKRYLDRWNEAGIDAVLCPTTPFSSVKNGQFDHGKSIYPGLSCIPIICSQIYSWLHGCFQYLGLLLCLIPYRHGRGQGG